MIIIIIIIIIITTMTIRLVIKIRIIAIIMTIRRGKWEVLWNTAVCMTPAQEHT